MRNSGFFLFALVVAGVAHAIVLRLPMGSRHAVSGKGQENVRMQVLFKLGAEPDGAPQQEQAREHELPRPAAVERTVALSTPGVEVLSEPAVLVDTDEEWQQPAYWDEVRQAVAEKLTYPPSARRQRVEGRVLLSLVIDRDGQLLKATPTSPHAKTVFSLAALEAARRAAPFSPPGAADLDGGRASAILPIRFELTSP